MLSLNPVTIGKRDRPDADWALVQSKRRYILVRVSNPAPAPNWLPGLDALRAFSILWVVWFHLEARDQMLGDGILRNLVMRGVTGVTVFFVISGFLITTLLLREEQRSGTIDLPGFYRRRAYRILPAAFAYLAVALGFTWANHLPWNPMEWLGAMLFFRNLVPPGADSHLTGHFWSLSIEEQFYLAWPLMVVLITPNRRIWVTLGLCLFAPFWRHLMTKLAAGGPMNVGRIDLNYDSLLVGALLALVQQRSGFRNLFDRYPIATWILPVALAGFIAQVSWGLPFGVLASVASPTIQVGLIALIIKILTEGRCRSVQVLCNLPPVVWLGRLSYSLYLWQTLFCEYAGKGPLWQRPWCILVALAAAMASYYLVEQPILRLRERRPST